MAVHCIIFVPCSVLQRASYLLDSGLSQEPELADMDLCSSDHESKTDRPRQGGITLAVDGDTHAHARLHMPAPRSRHPMIRPGAGPGLLLVWPERVQLLAPNVMHLLVLRWPGLWMGPGLLLVRHAGQGSGCPSSRPCCVCVLRLWH